MSIDPMTSYEQAEAEAVERQDEAVREKHFADAAIAAKACFGHKAIAEASLTDVTHVLLTVCFAPDSDFNIRLLDAFAADYGIPALLHVLATALESDRG